MLTLYIATPAHVSYGEAMSQVRAWLDYRKVETSGFKLSPDGRTGFEITFSSSEGAARFQEEFRWPPSPHAVPPTGPAAESPSP